MKKISISTLSLLLVILMLLAAFASCAGNSAVTDSGATSGSEAIESTEKANGDTEGNTESNTEGDNDSDTEAPDEGDGVETGKTLASDEALIIENAYSLANGVQAYFSDATRKEMTFENLNMSLEYALSSDQPQLVTSISNKNGNAYIQNTMDVFITMSNGKTYYGSKSNIPATANIYRFGYYFYEMRFEEQTFASNFNILDTNTVRHNQVYNAHDIDSYHIVKETKALSVTNSLEGNDPYIIFGNAYHGINKSADRYQFLKITMSADEAASTNAMIFVIAGDESSFNSKQNTSFTIANDGNVHEYLIQLDAIPGYTGTLKGLRLDISGPGATYEIHDLELIQADFDGAPTDLGIARIFNTYSDKLHQVLQVAAAAETSGIEAIGFTTDIAADTVSSIIIMNKDGSTVSDLASVTDWSEVAAVGFDVKDAGIFGYILPYDGESGTIKVTFENGVYNVTQTCVPANGTIIPSRGAYNTAKDYYDSVVPYNQNDFYMGNRIYTDESHSFDDFIYEALCEINPLGEKYFSVSASSTKGHYIGYDALRGIYTFSIDGLPHFNNAYYDNPNKHYKVTFSVRGDQYDRKVYLMTTTTSGALECAVLLDKNQMVLPVPMEVGKNFSEAAGERNLFNVNDETYGEAIFPMVIESGEKSTYTILNLYQNWGRFPLKQLSWIQFTAPYYHLSIGVTETNCILPWYSTKNSKGLNTLPDFRTMSGPLWATQPQHDSCGVHMWLIYTDSEGNRVTSENVADHIDSYGPTYADVKMDYISDDGKIKMSYVHTEMPQTDENRTYYEMKYEVLEDVTINDFRNNFQFYSVGPRNPGGYYKKIGYLDVYNTVQYADAVLETRDDNGNIVESGSKSYVLGNQCPYFSFFDMDGLSEDSTGHANVAALIYNSSFIIGGEEITPNFIINNVGKKISLSLDLGDVTLKAGDVFTINMILLPWGSAELDPDYSDEGEVNYYTVINEATGEKYMDKNVRDVRENTLLNHVEIYARQNTEVIESVFIPKVKTTNGQGAEFTLFGGHNNITVRVYGFDKLTVPKVLELVDGEWVEYKLNSADTPDKAGYLHYYDGYMAHYDGDGTVSYSFVIDMTDKDERSFRVAAIDDFRGWPSEPDIGGGGLDLLDVFVDAAELNDAVKDTSWVSATEISADQTYVSLYGTGDDALNHNGGKVNEGYLTAYKDASGVVESGHLLVIKYRIPTTNKRTIDKFEIFTSTLSPNAAGSNRVITTAIVADGNWQVLVIDLSKVTADGFTTKEFVTKEDGKYYAQLIRFDFFDKCMNTTDRIDLEFIALDNSIDDITRTLNENNTNFVENLLLIEGNKQIEVNIASGERIDNSAPTLESYVHPDCTDFTESTIDYAACVDGVNGKTLGGGANSKVLKEKSLNAAPIALSLNGNTIAAPEYQDSTKYDGTYLVVSGWVVADGGVDRYVWSADGGKTWSDCSEYKATVKDVSDAHLTNAAKRIGKENNSPFTAADDKKMGLFQGLNALNPTGISADLSDYVGKTVHILFAAVPAKATDTLCLIAYITDVKVVAPQEVVEAGPSYNEYVQEGSGYSVSDLAFAACIDRVVTTKHGIHVNSNSGKPSTLAYNNIPIASADTDNNVNTPGHYLVFSGWALVRSGTQKFVWSADGGMTWNDTELYAVDSIANVSDNIMVSDRIKGLGYTFSKEADGANCRFQAPSDMSVVKGLAANLQDYAGKTVDVIFAAVPNAAADTLCVITVVSGVQVP